MIFARSRWCLVAWLVCVTVFSCGDDSSSPTPADVGGADADVGETGFDDTGRDVSQDTRYVPGRADCDPLMPEGCALPWPSNLYLSSDSTTSTGYRLTFGSQTLPATDVGNQMSPEPFRMLDGYGASTSLLMVFPQLDASNLPPENDIARSLAGDAPIVWLSQTDEGLVRVPYWAELDSAATDPDREVLFVRPARFLDAGARQIIAVRGLRHRDGSPVQPSPAFLRLRAGTTADIAELSPRQNRFDEIFALLEEQEINRDELVLAWDFVTASSQTLHGPLLHMIDESLAEVGDAGPELTVTSVTRFVVEADKSGSPVDPHVALEIEGTFEVPSYLVERQSGAYSGTVLSRDEVGMPQRVGTREVPFWAMVPHRAMAADAEPIDIVMFGHGLLNSGDATFGDHNRKIAADHNVVFFGCNLSGMSMGEIPQALFTAQDPDNFVWLADTLHQGILEYVLLARAFPNRLATLEPLQDASLVRRTPGAVYYSGVSQGGIFGATLAAVSPDVQRVHLGVPGNNYSLLLERSVDFLPYLAIVQQVHSDRVKMAISLFAVQLLWDGTDPVSYIGHLGDPLPGRESAVALFAAAKGDYQVANLANEIVARSEAGVALMAGYGRPVPLVTETPYPHAGSGIVMYDFGNPWPPPGNVVPEEDELGDPHNRPKRLDHHNEQMIRFFRTGIIEDVCGGDGCTPD